VTYSLFIDDERIPADVTWATPQQQLLYRTQQWTIARNFLQVAQLIAERGMPAHISFDHDLGEGEKTGYDIARYLVQMDQDRERDLFGDVVAFAPDFTFYAHSMNPVGKENIMRYITNYLEFKRGH
jgi:hypothetical protein